MRDDHGGHNSLVAVGEWARRCDQEMLADLGCPYDPLAGQIGCPDERTLRDAYAKVDPGALTPAAIAPGRAGGRQPPVKRVR